MKILIPVDGSKPSINAVKYVVGLVRNLRSKCAVTLISVHDDAGLNHVRRFVSKDQIDDYLRELSDKQIKPAQKVLNEADVLHSAVIKRGNVAEEIVALAKKEKFDLIVMGTKGRGGLMDALVGSVAQRVVGAAKQPVVLVK
ncbi:MAG: universal stress protein [Burkholderiaceae bacterium]|nr:universal stress protein [Burkholderiaceae bacterium]